MSGRMGPGINGGVDVITCPAAHQNKQKWQDRAGSENEKWKPSRKKAMCESLP